MEMWMLEYQLINSSPEYVFDWLKENIVQKHYLGDESRENLEKSLLARNNELINLGLALYGEVPEVGYSLYRSKDPVIQKAALTGRSVRPVFLDKSWILNTDVVPALLGQLERSDEDESSNESTDSALGALLNNPLIPDSILEALYEKSEVFKTIGDDSWIRLVAMSASNERLTRPYNSTWMDGYDEYRYNAVFAAAWNLFEKFPVSSMTATLLERMSNRLVPEGPSKFNTAEVMKRWRSSENVTDEKLSYVRTGLVKLIPAYSDEFKELANSDDLALRKGYYLNVKNIKPDDVTKFFEKDGIGFLESALYNKSFYSNDETRAALKKACWNAPDEHSRLDYPNYFNMHCEKLSSEHPEWFKDTWDGEVPFEDIKDPSVRLEKRVENLNQQVNEIHRSMFVIDEYASAPLENSTSTLQTIQMDLVSLARSIQDVGAKIPGMWVWLIVGASIGYGISKF